MSTKSKQLRIGLGIFTTIAVVGGLVGLILLAIEMHS